MLSPGTRNGSRVRSVEAGEGYVPFPAVIRRYHACHDGRAPVQTGPTPSVHGAAVRGAWAVASGPSLI